MNPLALTCQELGIRNLEGRIITDSLGIARMFDKGHNTVIRDIEELIQKLHCTNLYSEISWWFRRSSYVTSRGRSEPMFETNRDGFMLAVMAYTTLPALELKVRYILAFNAMEAALRDPVHVDLNVVMSMVREVLDRVPGKLDGAVILSKLDHMINGIAAVGANVEQIGRHQKERSRTKFKPWMKDVMRLTIHRHYRGCDPVSGEVILDDNGQQLVGADNKPTSEYDHFNGPNNGGPENGWLISKATTHAQITRGELTRQELQPFFEVYQKHLLKVWKPQITLFPSRNGGVQMNLF